MRKGDIIIEKSGGSDKQPVGRVVYYDGLDNTYLFNNFTALLRVKNQKIWVPRYVFYALLKNYRQGGTIPFENKTTGLHNLKIDAYINNFKINEIPINIQQKICVILDKIQGIIRVRKQQLIDFDTLIKARFVEMFGNFDLSQMKEDWLKISEIGTVIGGSTPKTENSDYWDGEYRWITPAELEADSGYIYDSVRKLTKAGVDSCSLKELPVNTVLLTSRAPIGKVGLAGETLYCNQGFKNIICKDRVLPKYLYFLLLFNVDYLNLLGRGATFKEISKRLLKI